MKMLVSMLFMGMVSNGSMVRNGLSKKANPLSLDRLAWPGSDTRETTTEDRISFEADLPWGVEEDVPEAMLDHFVRAQSLAGRMALNSSFMAHRLRMLLLTLGPPALKRTVDVVASALLLLLLSPIFLLIAILVKLEDGGPVFFAQTRVGKNGRLFKMYKVRSMCRNAEARLQEVLDANEHKEGVTFKLKDDPRITRCGKLLRKFSLDELPQLYNVFTGNMSLVGPRPPIPREVAMYTLADRRRLLVTPGITCIWQISGRSEIDFSGQVKLDVQYIENQNLWTDLKILVRTVPVVISGRGAS